MGDQTAGSVRLRSLSYTTSGVKMTLREACAAGMLAGMILAILSIALWVTFITMIQHVDRPEPVREYEMWVLPHELERG